MNANGCIRRCSMYASCLFLKTFCTCDYSWARLDAAMSCVRSWECKQAGALLQSTCRPMLLVYTAQRNRRAAQSILLPEPAFCAADTSRLRTANQNSSAGARRVRGPADWNPSSPGLQEPITRCTGFRGSWPQSAPFLPGSRRFATIVRRGGLSFFRFLNVPRQESPGATSQRTRWVWTAQRITRPHPNARCAGLGGRGRKWRRIPRRLSAGTEALPTGW